MYLFLPRKDHGRVRWRKGAANRARSRRCLWCHVCLSPKSGPSLPSPPRQQTHTQANLHFPYSLIIFLAVYLLGGIAYQRTVMHQRGWRQLPNYNVWASIFSLVKDIIIILTSSCARWLPRRQGYNQLPGNGRGGRGGRPDDENRLIDQLDEEWDD